MPKRISNSGYHFDPCILVVLVVAVTLSCFPPILGYQYQEGVVEIKIDESKLRWNPDVHGFVFDTSSCMNCRAAYPAWSFLGNMHIDSVLTAFITEPLLERSQLGEVILDPVDLFDVLWAIRAYRMTRRYRGATPGMVLPGPVHGCIGTTYKPELSPYWRVYFDTSFDTDLVRKKLSQAKGVKKAYRIPVP